MREYYSFIIKFLIMYNNIINSQQMDQKIQQANNDNFNAYLQDIAWGDKCVDCE